MESEDLIPLLTKHRDGLYSIKDAASLVARAEQRVSWAELRKAWAAIGGESSDDGDHLAREFAVAVCREIQARTVLDMWATEQGLLTAIAEECALERAVGIPVGSWEASLLKQFFGRKPFEWVVGYPPEVLPSLEGPFDLVIGEVPPGSVSGRVPIEVEDESAPSVTHAEATMLQGAMHLSPDGMAILSVPHGDLFRAQDVQNLLSRHDLHVDAVVFVREPVFFGEQSDGYVLLVSRTSRSALFLAVLSHRRQIGQIVKNWRSRKTGILPDLGMLTPLSTFVSISGSRVREQLDGAAREAGLELVTLGDVSIEWSHAVGLGGLVNDEEELLDRELQAAAVRLPLDPEAPASLAHQVGPSTSKAATLFRLNEEVAFAPYVVAWLNSDMGALARRSVASGIQGHERVSMSSLSETPICLPAVKQQEAVVELLNQARGLSQQLHQIEQGILKRPRRLDESRRSLAGLNRESGIEALVTALPFPIASVLARYLAENRIPEKNLALFHFFEALAEFTVAVGLSGVRGPDGNYDPLRRIAPPDEWVLLRTSSFGTWVRLGQRVGKEIRRRLSGDADSRSATLRSFAQERTDMFDALFGKALFATLSVAADLRNEWIGHSGARSSREEQRRLERLEGLLSEVHPMLYDGFRSIRFFQALKGEYTEGVFKHEALSLMGSSQIFRRIVIPTVIPLESHALFLGDIANTAPMRLVPLLRIMPGPVSEQNACYFFNRVRNKNVRWISYHFEAEAEQDGPDSELSEMLDFLTTERA